MPPAPSLPTHLMPTHILPPRILPTHLLPTHLLPTHLLPDFSLLLLFADSLALRLTLLPCPRPQVGHTCNSILGGLVGVTAGCASYTAGASFAVGICSAIVYHGE